MKTTIDAMKRAACLFDEIYRHDDQHAFDARKGAEILHAAIAREEVQTVEPVALMYQNGKITFLGATYWINGESVKRLYDRPAPPPSGEREVLISELRTAEQDHWSLGIGINNPMLLKHSADMLAADAQAERVPMTDEEVEEVWNAVKERGWSDLDFARAIEAHHKIGVK